MAGNEAAADVVPVVCRLCGTRMYARRADVGKAVRCPDCETLTEIRLPPPARPIVEPRDVGQYRVGATDWRSSASPHGEGEEPASCTVRCPRCGARLGMRRSDAGKRARCPDCDVKFRLPAWRPPVRHEPQPPVMASYGLGPAVERPRPPAAIDTDDSIQTEEPAARRPAGDEPFTVAAWSFPLRQPTLAWCLAIAAGSAAVFACLGGAYYASRTLGEIGVIGAGALVLAAIWPLLWTLSFAAACGLAVIEQTAAGADGDVDGPEGDWRQWFFPMLIVGFHLLFAGVMASALFRATVDWLPGAWLVWIVALHVVFPLTLLSALEASSAVAVYSGPVWNSLWQRPVAWLRFWVAVAGLLIAGVSPIVGLWLLASRDATWQFELAVLAVGYVALAWPVGWLIYARLLGQLAWRITSEEDDADAADDNRQTDDENPPRWRHPALHAVKSASTDS